MCDGAHKVRDEALKELAYPDGPFGWVVLVPHDCITIVRRKLVMEVVIALSEGDQRCDHMIARGVSVIEWLVLCSKSVGVQYAMLVRVGLTPSQ